MPLGVAYPFGLRDVKITPFTNQTTEVTGTGVDLPAARIFTFTEAEEFTTLEGDDKVITTRGKGATISWELEGGGYSADVIKLIIGGTLTDSGTAPAQIRKVQKKATDTRPFFKVEGQSMSDNGGDVHGVLYRCRATGDFEMHFENGTWFLTNVSGEAFPSLAAATTDALYEISYNETITPIA